MRVSSLTWPPSQLPTHPHVSGKTGLKVEQGGNGWGTQGSGGQGSAGMGMAREAFSRARRGHPATPYRLDTPTSTPIRVL